MKRVTRGAGLRSTIGTIAMSVVLAVLSAGAASAAELKVLISGAMLGAVGAVLAAVLRSPVFLGRPGRAH